MPISAAHDLPLGWTAFLGGTGRDAGSGIAVDGQGNVYVAGSTWSTAFPVTPGATSPHPGGMGDAFVASYDPSGRLRWATCLGGSGFDGADGLTVDGQGDAFITGNTESTDFPVTSGLPSRAPAVGTTPL